MGGKHSIDNAPLTRERYEKVELVFPVARFISGYLAPRLRRWLTDGATKKLPLRGFRFFLPLCAQSMVRFPIIIGYSVFDIRCFCLVSCPEIDCLVTFVYFL